MKQDLMRKAAPDGDEAYDVSRRKFFQLTGGLAGMGLLIASCHKDSSSTTTSSTSINLGSGDIGVLNYAYALEQLEAAYYTMVISMTASTSVFTPDQLSLMTNIRDHEIAHREFLKAALGTSAIPTLTAANLNFSTVDFTSASSIFTAAKGFEDLGVSAYNGAGRLLTSPTYLTLAGKIVSVEARHAAYIREMLTPNSFADSTAVNSMGLDEDNTPATVLTAASAYLKGVTINYSNLPNQ